MQVRTDTGDGLPLRGWQRRALVKYLATQPRDFLAVATPGSGRQRSRCGSRPNC